VLIDFLHPFVAILNGKVAIMGSLSDPPHLKRVATISCEIVISILNTNISQGSVAKRLRCGGVFNDRCCKLLLSVPCSTFVKISQYYFDRVTK